MVMEDRDLFSKLVDNDESYPQIGQYIDCRELYEDSIDA